MARYETTVEQEIKDHELDHILGLGRGVLNVEQLSEHLEQPVDDQEEGRVTLGFIRELDEAGSNGYELINALTSETPSTIDLLENLKKCSVRGAVNVLLDMGTDSQREYLIGRLEEYGELVTSGVPIVEQKYKNGEYVDEITGHQPAEPKDIRTGLWRDVVFASMIGTPELGALTIARNHMRYAAQGESDEARTIHADMHNLPRIRGYHSYIFPSRMEQRWKYEDGENVELPPESIDGEIGYAFPELAKTYVQVLRRVERSNPELDDAGLEHKAVRELARLIEKSTEYDDPHRGEGSPYRSHFAEQLAWAQLGEQTQRQLRGMRQKIIGVDLHNIGRFIGKSGDNPYEKEWRRIEQFAGSVSPDAPSSAREYFLLLAHKEIEKQHKTLGNEAAATIITNGSASIDAINQMSDEEILTRFSEERSRLEQKRNSRMSLAQKALILHFADKPEDGESLIDWINDAPFGLINRTHTMLTRGVSKETAFAYAVAEHTFPGEPLTHELIDACRGVTRETLNRTRALSQKLTETNQAISLEDRLILGRVSNRHDAGDVLDLLTQGYSASRIEQYPWLCHLDTNEIIDFPASGSESQKQKWLAENSYVYLRGGWNKKSIGKIIATRLESGIESSVHDASQWLETFQIPEEAYNIGEIANARQQEGFSLDAMEREKLRDADTERDFIESLLAADPSLRDRLTYGAKAAVSMGDKLTSLYQQDGSLRQEFNQSLGRATADLTSAFWDEMLADDADLRAGLEAFEADGGRRKKFFADVLKQRPELGKDLEGRKRTLHASLEGTFYDGVIAGRPEWAVDSGDDSFAGEDWFYSPEYQLLYRAAVEEVDGKPRYKGEAFTRESLFERARELIDTYVDESFGSGKDETNHRVTAEELHELIDAAQANASPIGPDANLAGLAAELKAMRTARGNYIRDAQTWLSKHATSPHQRLTKVWGDRAVALAEGVGDSAREIEIWQATNALRKHLEELERTRRMPSNLTVSEVVTEYKGWVDELSRAYGSERVVRAISEFKTIRNPEALLPPATIDLTTDDGVYKAEVLAKDDPRGATIGVDTGCCMTLDGASANCIRSGYQDSGAGFFALYTPQGRLAAQSYFYVNPEQPDVLVLDNIEANQGRDTNKIVKLYKEALEQYLAERFTSDSDWKIRTVHVGTGYGDAVKSTVLQLPQAPTIRNKPGIYTDADDQRRLLELSDKQIGEAKEKTIQVEQVEKVKPQHYPEIAVHTISSEQAEVIRELEKQIYPKHMRQYRDREMLTEEFQMRGMEQFSFLVAAEADSSRDFLGYCMAYLEQSETEPARTEPVLYAADLAIVPEAQGGRIGSKMFEELLERANAHGVDKVELHARETTSYAALMKSNWVQRLLYNQGFRLTDHGAVDEFDDGQGNIEKLYLVSLEKA